jgi:hypothetical protein
VKYFRPTLAILELLLGSVLIAISIYGLWINRGCSADGSDCGVLGVVSAIYFSVNGLLFVVAGIGSYFWAKLPLLAFQVPLLIALVAFHLWLS